MLTLDRVIEKLEESAAGRAKMADQSTDAIEIAYSRGKYRGYKGALKLLKEVKDGEQD